MNLGRKGTHKELAVTLSDKPRRRTRWLFRFGMLAAAGIVLLACLGGSMAYGMVKGILDDAPKITTRDIIPTEEMSFIYDADGNLMDTLIQAGSNRTNVKDYDTIPKNLIDAFVAVEDARFWEHNGIDMKGIVRALVLGVTSGFKNQQGASTITQQLIKNNVFTDWTSEESLGDKLERKIQEQYLAVQLEKNTDKKDILLNYLNTINLGNSTLGIAQASKRYYGKSYTDLSLSESAVIASITNSPTTFNPITHPEANHERTLKVLDDMEKQGYISAEEKAEARADLDSSLYQRIADYNETYTETKDDVTSYFTDAVITQVIEDLQTDRGFTADDARNMVYSGGLRIYTTMEPKVQKIIDSEVNNKKHYPNELTKYSCTFTITVTYKNGETETFTDTGLKLWKRETDPDFKLIADSKKDLKKLIKQFALSIIDEDEGEEWELTRIDYTLQPQVSFVVMDQATGYVLGMTGGRGPKTANRALNRATDSTRQPGSLFKVLAGFTPAIDSCGDTLATTYYDGPYTLGRKTFSNYWGNHYYGYSSIRDSIVYSMNIISVKCLNETVTPGLAFEYLKSYGFTTLVESRTDSNGQTYTDIGASISLGGLTDGVTNLETTAAYATIANQGIYTEPVLYTRITDSDGNVIIDNKPETHEVMKKTTAYLLTSAMEEVMDGNKIITGLSRKLYGTGKAADVPGMSIAGKTGTTSSDRDVWFAGYSPYYTAVIWSGYDDSQEIARSSSTNYHKEVWQAIMTRLHKGLEDPGFTQPKGIVEKTICRKSGKLAIPGVCNRDPRGDMTYTEYFRKGTEPDEVCDRHVAVTLCATSGKRATSNCKQTYTRVFMTLDASADSASDDTNYALSRLGTCELSHYVPPTTEAVETSEGGGESGKAEESKAAETTKAPDPKPDEEHAGTPGGD